MLDCESLAQRMSALEEHIEQLNDRMRDLEEKLEDNYLLLSRQQSTSTDEDTDPDSLTPSYPQTVENCCAPSIFVHGELVYEGPHVSTYPMYLLTHEHFVFLFTLSWQLPGVVRHEHSIVYPNHYAANNLSQATLF